MCLTHLGSVPCSLFILFRGLTKHIECLDNKLEMKKPALKSETTKGFSLVELLIVVTIIAVLGAIGMAVFGGLQKGARDARREADIDAIGKAMEVHYNDASGQYNALAESMFAGGKVPEDPLKGNNNCGCSGTPPTCLVCMYCSTSTDGCVSGFPEVAVGQPAAGTTFKVCTNLENNTRYCRSNQR